MVASNIADIAFGIQSAKGTVVTPSGTNTYRCLVQAGWLAPVRDEAVLEETGTTRLRNQAYTKMVRAGGAPAFWARMEMIGALLYGVLGAKATTGAADPYTHTFTVAATQPWMTFWTGLGTTLFAQFVDCKITSLKLESSAGNPLKVTVDVLGMTPTFETPNPVTSIVTEVTAPLLHADGKGFLKVEGTAVSAIDNFVLTIATGVAAAQGDGYSPDSINEGMLGITLETGQIIADYALWNRIHFGSATPSDGAAVSTSPLELAGSPAGIDFLFTRAAASPGPERSLEVKAPRLMVQSVSGVEGSPSGAPLRMGVTYAVLQPAAAASGVTAVLKNAKTGY